MVSAFAIAAFIRFLLSEHRRSGTAHFVDAGKAILNMHDEPLQGKD